MAKAGTMIFKRGDGCTQYFQIPEDSWSPGGALFFAAKPQPDDDDTDAAAVIDKSFDDDSIVDESHEQYLDGYVTYQLDFVAGDVSGVSFADGSLGKKFLGEFQFVPTVGEPISFPGDNEFIETIVYPDIKRGVTP